MEEDTPWDITDMGDEVGGGVTGWHLQTGGSSSDSVSSDAAASAQEELLGLSSDEFSSSDAAALPWPSVMGAASTVQNWQPTIPTPMVAVPTVGARAVASALPPAPDPREPAPRLLSQGQSAGPPTIQKGGSEGAGTRLLRYDDGEMTLETVMRFLSSEYECVRPDWMLSDGSKYEDMPGRVYIEHVNIPGKTERRKRMTDNWHPTSCESKYKDTGIHFKEDTSGAYSTCTEPADADARGTIALCKDALSIELRAPGGSQRDASAAGKLRADLWKVQFHYATTGASSESSNIKEIRLYHILPIRVSRRGQEQASKVKRESQQELQRTKRRTKPKMARKSSSRPSLGHESAASLNAGNADNDESETPRVLPPTVIEENRDIDYFISFQSGTKQVGAVKLTPDRDGVHLESGGGDLAEFFLRAEGEAEFEEGDVVGFLKSEVKSLRISRITEGAIAVGVISRRMIVAGPVPEPHKKHLYDTVALCGQVPVKVRGPSAPGDSVVPSGQHDGTAVVSDCELPFQHLGFVLQNSIRKRSEEADQFQLVDIKVTDPDSYKDKLAAAIVDVKNAAVPVQHVEQLEMQLVEMDEKSQKKQVQTMCWFFVGFAISMAALVVAVVVAWRTRFTRDAHESATKSIPAVACHAENVSAVELTRCNLERSACYGPVVHFNDQNVGDSVEVACPSGFEGALRRTCSAQNTSHFSGRCIRTECPQRLLELPGGTGVTIAPVPKGDTQIINCPEPGFSGQLKQQCLDNTTWGEMTGQCTRHMCSSSVEYLGRYVHAFNHSVDLYQSVPIVAPRAEYGRSVQVAVCRQFTRTGSCEDNTAGDAGYARADCDAASGKWMIDRDSTVFASALSYDVLRMSKPLPLAQSLYNMLVSCVGNAVTPPSGSTWKLPAEGVLTPVMIGFEGEHREIFATADNPLERSDRPGSIDTNPSHDPQSTQNFAQANGRAAAAFARVACAELGFGYAPFVTSCQGLASLLDDLPHRPLDATRLLEELCPEVHRPNTTVYNCPNWLEVRDPPLNDAANTQLNWLRASVLTPIDDIGLHAAPVFETADASNLPNWLELQSFSNVGPIPESPSCDGTEDSVLRCFQRQMVIPTAHRKLWTRKCSRRIIIGCSSRLDPSPEDRIRPELGASILMATVKALQDYSGFAVSVAVRPANHNFGQQNLTIEATLIGPVTHHDHHNSSGHDDVAPVSCTRNTRHIPVVMGSLFPLKSPTSFKLKIPPQCRYKWSPYRPYQYNISLRLRSFSKNGEEPALIDPVGRNLDRLAKLRSDTASDGTWVIGDSVRPYPDKSTPLTKPKIFIDTDGPFNCTTGDLATKAEITTSAESLCWGDTIRDRVNTISLH